MPSRPDPVSLVLANLPLLLGILLVGAAYTSSDPSGLQYMMLPLGAVFIGGGGVALAVLRLQGRAVSRWFAALIAAGLLAAGFPTLLGVGYRDWVDPVGATATASLLVGQVTLCLRHVRRARDAAP